MAVVRTLNVIALAAAAVTFGLSGQARADHVGGTVAPNHTFAGHSGYRPQPAYISTYAGPSYYYGGYVDTGYTSYYQPYYQPYYQQTYYTAPVPLGIPTYYTPSIYAGAFVPPPIVFNTSFVAPNYFLPGDFYARSAYYVPASVTPVVIYPARYSPRYVTRFGAVMPMHPGGQPSQLTFTPMFQR